MNKTYKTVFIAIPIINQQPQTFKALQDYFDRAIQHDFPQKDCSFKPAKELHITIAYIGLANDATIASIKDLLEAAIKRFVSLNIPAQLTWDKQIYLFNNAISLTFHYDEGLNLLANFVRDALAAAAIVYDDRFEFKAHLTIGRLQPARVLRRSGIKRKIIELLKKKTAHLLMPIPVQEVGLYESGVIQPLFTSVLAH